MKSEYEKTGVDVEKQADRIFRLTIGSSYPAAFSVIKDDPDFPEYALVAHADGAGSKPIQYYLNYKETGDIESFRGIAQDVIAMNIDDIMCVGARPVSFVDYVSINKSTVPKKEFLEILNDEIAGLIATLDNVGVELPFNGGETADHPDQIQTLDVAGFMQGRAKKERLITGERIEPGNSIVGLRSGGRTRYEKTHNSGIMCNGITLARRCLMSSDYMTRYPEITGTSKGYRGRFQVSDPTEDSNMTIGEMIASPTRIFAPVILRILSEFGDGITGLVHNTQGGLTKSLKLGHNLKYVKNDLPDPDPIFPLIQAESGESWREMYRDFNMGCGFEVIAEREAVDEIIQISEDLGVGARVIGQVADGPEWNQVVIESSLGTFKYEGSRRET